MCGIVGAISKNNVVPMLLQGVQRLEYRGYDSAGLGLIDGTQHLLRVRALGKVANLAKKIAMYPLSANIGIAHTRWATHGAPSEANAHPHAAGDILLVHNGIIDNYAPLKADLLKRGLEFASETDTEVVAQLLHQECIDHPPLSANAFRKAIEKTVKKLQGAYALVIMHRQFPDQLFAVRHGSPLVIGLSIDENFVASDSLSLLPFTQKFVHLQENDLAEISEGRIKILNEGQEVQREIEVLAIEQDSALLGAYRHYMEKEIAEQPEVVAHILSRILHAKEMKNDCFGVRAAEILPKVKRIRIIACGTSYHAGLVAKYWLEAQAGIACDVEIASEYRYRKTVVEEGSLFITISQSGETADTLAALRLSRTQGYIGTLTICNVATSTLVRESDLVFLMQAGVEVGVASTKAFSAAMLGLLLLTDTFCRLNGKPGISHRVLEKLPEAMEQVLSNSEMIIPLAKSLANKEHVLFLGRGLYYPLAMEGALKLKEISYIHAEAYAAGELKHGPLALVDKNMPVVVLVPPELELNIKTRSNIEEVIARGGEVFALGDLTSFNKKEKRLHLIDIVKSADALLFPFLIILLLQLLAYHVALLKGHDVDQPRNLAKSVTVE